VPILKTCCTGISRGVLSMMADLRVCPYALVVEGPDMAFVLDFPLSRPWDDAPRVGGAEFLEDSVSGEGDEGFLAMGLGGKRPHGGSLPFERGCHGVDIALVLLRHEI